MTVRSALLALLCLACVQGGPAPAQEKEAPPAENLFEARRRGRVELEAIAMHGYRKIEITVKNLTDRSLRLDPAGSVLLPPDPALQRLGLAGVVGGVPGEDSSLILLRPRGSWTGEIHAVCLDFGKGTPPNGVPYELSAEPAGEKALRVLRYWAENPHIRQAMVNDVIWTDQDLDTLKTQVLPPWLLEARLVPAGGALHWLSGGKDLYRVSADGSAWSKIGENFDQVRAGGGQMAGYLHTIPGLRWYNLSQKRWEYFFLPSPPEKVLLGPDRSMFVLARRSLLVYRPGQKQFESVDAPSLKDAALSPASVSPTLWILDAEGRVRHRPAAGGDWTTLPGKGFQTLGATLTAVYASSDRGVFRFRKGQWRAVADRGSRCLAGSRHAFLFRKRTLTVLPDADQPSRNVTLPKRLIHATVDRYTDTVWALDESGRVLRLAEDGTWHAFADVPDLEEKGR